MHGVPSHGITLYIDRQWAVRGMEIFKHTSIEMTK